MKKIGSFLIVTFFFINSLFSQSIPELIPFLNKKYKFGFSDSTGNIKIPCKYDMVRQFKNGYAVVNSGADFFHLEGADGGVWGLIDKTGKETITPQYTQIYFISGNNLLVSKDSIFKIVTTHGKDVMKLTYSDFSYYDIFDLLQVEDNDKYGMVSVKQGKEIIPCKYDYLAFVKATGIIYGVKRQDTTYFSIAGAKIDKPVSDKKKEIEIKKTEDGKLYFQKNDSVIFDNFNFSWGFSDDLAAIDKNGKWGYIDKNGKITIDFQFDEAESFHNGYAAVNIDGRWGVINKNGNVVVERKYDMIGQFNKYGVALVYLNERTGAVNTKGEEIIPCEFEMVYYFENGITSVFSSEKVRTKHGKTPAGRFVYVDCYGNFYYEF